MSLNTPLHMIVYISELAPPDDKQGAGAFDITLLLRTIQKQAAARNAELDITGVLLFWDGSFLQVFEGKEDAVRKLFSSIETDPRHQHVRLLLDEPISERLFFHWRMGCLNLNSECSFDKSELIEMMQAYRATFKPTSKSLKTVLRRTLPLKDTSI